MVAAPCFFRLATVVYLAIQAQADIVEFFYNQEQDECVWDATDPLRSENNTAKGGLCAYVPATKQVYACPAPDATCWTTGQSCTGDNGNPDSTQIQCKNRDTTWCCLRGENCHGAKFHLCLSQFASPNNGTTEADAQAAEFSAIPSASLGTAFVAAVPSVISTATFSVPFASTGSASSTSTNSGYPSLSGGDIAGIVIGAVLAIAIVCATIVYVVRSSRRNTARSKKATKPEIPMPIGYRELPADTPITYHEKSSRHIVEAGARTESTSDGQRSEGHRSDTPIMYHEKSSRQIVEAGVRTESTSNGRRSYAHRSEGHRSDGSRSDGYGSERHLTV